MWGGPRTQATQDPPHQVGSNIMRGGFQMVEANLRVAMRFFGEATGSGEVRAADGVEMVYSGLDYGVFNIAMLERPVVSERDLTTVLATAARFYHERKVRWSFWVCEDLLEPLRAASLPRNLHRSRHAPISHAPGMLALALAAPSRPLPEIECRAVSDRGFARCLRRTHRDLL